MRKVTALSFILLLLLALPVNVSAAGTLEQDTATLTTTIPSQHLLTVSDSPNVKVMLAGVGVRSVNIDRHTTPTVTIVPDSGYVIDRVLFNGEDVTDQVIGGFFTLPKMVGDATLTVTTRPAPHLNRRHKVDVQGTVILNGAPLRGAVLELRPDSERAYTDRDGAYRLDGVAMGAHDLLIWKDGILVGYTRLEIRLSERREGLEVKNGGYLATVTNSTEAIRLDLYLSDDGAVEMGHFKTYEFWEAITDNPKTGDIIETSVAIMILSGMGIVYLLLQRRKRKSQEPSE